MPFSEGFCLKVWRRKNFFLKKTCFSQIVYLGWLNKNLATLLKFFCRKSKKVLFRLQKGSEKKTFFFFGNFFFKTIPSVHRRQFRENLQILILNVLNWHIGSSNFRKKMWKSSTGYVICSLENVTRNVLRTSERFSVKVWKRQKIFSLNKALVSSKKIFRANGMKFWQPSRCFF